MSGSFAYIRQRFDQNADKYLSNPLTQWVGRSELDVLRSLIGPADAQQDRRVLDFGCGTGRVTSMLLELGYSVTGYDISPAMLDRARVDLGSHPDVVFTSDASQLVGTWPLIVSLGVLDYYVDTSPLWNEWSRLGSPSGRLVVTAPNGHSPLARTYAFFSRFTCQAYVTTADKLQPAAQAAGLSLADIQFAFPRSRWGHTIVMKFQRNQF